MNHLKKHIPYLLLAIGFFVISVPLWLKIDILPLRLWDESRNAVSAIEMYETHNWLVRTVDFVPDNWDLKPPLLTWFQVASLNVFGLNELGIRFPSLVFSISSLLVLFALVHKMTQNRFAAFLASTITATSAGFYGDHVARFGDHDALLILLVVSLLYSVYSYASSGQVKYIYLAGLFTTLGILAKSIAIGMTIPGMVLWLLYDKKLVNLFRSRHFYIALVSAILSISAYYAAREHLQPGYLQLVWELELFPRFFNSSSTLTFPEYNFWYYLKLLHTEHMKFWVWASLLLVLAPLFYRKKRGSFVFWLFQVFTFLFIISNGTKNYWYSAPVVPMLAAAIAVSFHLITSKNTKHLFWLIVPILSLAALSYHRAYNYSFYPGEKPYEWETNGISYFLKDSVHLSNVTANTQILLDEERGYEPHKFYLKALRLEQNLNIQRAEIYTIKPSDTLLISHLSTYQKLKTLYNVEVLDSSYSHTKLLTISSMDKLVQIDSVSQLSSIE